MSDTVQAKEQRLANLEALQRQLEELAKKTKRGGQQQVGAEMLVIRGK